MADELGIRQALMGVMERAVSTFKPLKVMTLAGGPDRERPVSIHSGQNVTQALMDAGHEVITGDVLPDDLAMLDRFEQWQGDVIFPVLHGSWGEGGGLQAILDQRGLRYVGSRADSATLCMDKHSAKAVFTRQGLPTPAYEYLSAYETPTLSLPVVVKAPREGSSIDLAICHTPEALAQARGELSPRHDRLLIEQFVEGIEVTVGIIPAGGDGLVASRLPRLDGYMALPTIHIVPAATYYDYQAKYTREDTQYRFDIDLSKATLEAISRYALEAHRALGCRHLSRVDFMIDRQHRPWLLEVNTLPGFTGHSLLPMAARQAGLSMPELVDRLVQVAMDDLS